MEHGDAGAGYDPEIVEARIARARAGGRGRRLPPDLVRVQVTGHLAAWLRRGLDLVPDTAVGRGLRRRIEAADFPGPYARRRLLLHRAEAELLASLLPTMMERWQDEPAGGRIEAAMIGARRLRRELLAGGTPGGAPSVEEES